MFRQVCRVVQNSVRYYSDKNNPYIRTINILKNQASLSEQKFEYPRHADVVIIGGGIVGSSIAYWLKTRAGNGLRVVVIEKDPTYRQASTVLSAGGLRQQFSLPENVLMSQYCATFLRNVKENLGADVDVQFAPHGYLVLATEDRADVLQANVKMQRELGVRNELLTPAKLKERFPWLNVEDIKLGCIGIESEGWFDPWALLCGFRKKAIELGAEYIKGEVVDFGLEQQRDVLMEGIPPGSFKKLKKIYYETDDGERREIEFAICALAAGCHSGEIAKKALIGVGDGILSVPLPIEPRKRCIYCFDTQDPNAPGINTPMVMNPTGMWVRRDGLGNNFICGKSPNPSDDHISNDLEVDYQLFDNEIWPDMAHRVPAFENLKLKNAWAGWYEYNTFDENGIIGQHPYHINMVIASGFSGHGLQQAPATGRAIAELIVDSKFTSIDLTRFCFDRLLTDRPMIESNIY